MDNQRLSITRTIVCVDSRMQPSTGKTNHAARTIDLHDSTIDIHACWRDDHHDRFGHHDPERGLVVRGDGETVNPQTLSQGFDRAVGRTCLPKLTLQGLRHMHATLLLQAGVSERLGHSKPAFTMAGPVELDATSPFAGLTRSRNRGDAWGGRARPRAMLDRAHRRSLAGARGPTGTPEAAQQRRPRWMP